MIGTRSYLAAACFVAALLPCFAPRSARAGDAGSHESDSAALRNEFFEKRVRPVLAANCYNCHSASTNTKGGLRVDDRNGLLVGGGRGAALVPGDAEASLLIRAIRQGDDDLKMPPEGQLAAEQIADLTQWINEGAAWPAVELPDDVGVSSEEYAALRREHWAWQPLRAGELPAISDTAWPRDPVDQYLLAALEARGLKPVRDADKHALLRRVTFDLAGLPPTPEEVEAFLADDSGEAFSKVVDRLLASPAFGERWGRHWLDVARYGESSGSSRNLPLPHAWRYRDYVIDSLNADKPFDQFVREQIAGDLLPAESVAKRDEQLTATGFLALGVKDVNQRFKVRFLMDNIDEQIDTVSRSVLAITASCARCHDHKFDPIPTADYYALAGIFSSTELCAGLRNKMGGGGLDYYDPQLLVQLSGFSSASTVLTPEIEELQKQVAEARAEFEKLRGTPEGNVKEADGRPKRAVARQKLNKLQAELVALTDPAASSGRVVHGVRDAQTIGDTAIRVRGEAEQLGPVVPRGFLTLLEFEHGIQINAAQSGRLELAAWLTSPRNPLTPRVIVNRVWQHLFGAGLVKTVDNFGVNGDVPSHPELLDYLASEFVRDGWSIKRLVRRLTLTHSYQLAADATPENLAADPENRRVWRHSPRRLDAEEIRDTMLAVAGRLDPTRPEVSPAKKLLVTEVRNNGPEARQIASFARASVHRSVYLPLLRSLTPTSLEVFDFANPGLVTGQRAATTVPPQSLYLLNDAFVRSQALKLAERLLEQTSLSEVERVEWVYRLALGRPATTNEITRAAQYVTEFELALREPSVAEGLLASADVPTTTTVQVASTGDDAKPKPLAAGNPDEAAYADQADVQAEVVASSPRVAAWASFCQALLGSAEFRYLK